jgi:hypothetical protein
MVDKLKDKADLMLESLFRSEPIRDEGFSVKVMVRVRRQTWIRRLTMPIAFVVGAAIAFKPLSGLVVSLSGLLKFIPQSLGSQAGQLPIDQLPQLSTIWMGGMLVIGVMMASRLLQD